jgi:TfoX/Sxy family transcriptional regulator of competence genes
MAKWRKVAPEEKQRLAERLRAALAGRRGVTEKRMFGGICFLLRDHMLCGTGSGNFLFRVGKEAHAAAVKRHGAKAMVHSGRRMEGFIWVDPTMCNARSVKAWISLATAYVGKLPLKKKR